MIANITIIYNNIRVDSSTINAGFIITAKRRPKPIRGNAKKHMSISILCNTENTKNTENTNKSFYNYLF